MKKGILARTLSVMAAFLLALPSAAQSYAADGGMPAFSRERFFHSGTWLPYRKAAFKIGEEKPAALILYLHGGTSRGDDNTAQLDEPAVSAISRHVSAHGLHAVLIVPQCPAGQFWAGAMSNVLTALVEDYAARDSIDASRLYVLGSSMGGTGTWSLLDNCPGLFAAAMPVAGNPSGHSARNVALTPVLTVMGTADHIMDLDTVRLFIDSLIQAGGEARLDVEYDWTHEQTCEESYTPSRLDWLLGHAASATTGLAPRADRQTPTVIVCGRTITLSDGGRFQVHAPDGRSLARGTVRFLVATPGVYLIRAGGLTAKVAVR